MVKWFIIRALSFSRGLICKLRPVEAAHLRVLLLRLPPALLRENEELPEVSSPGCAWNTSGASPSDDVAELLAVPSDEAHLLTFIHPEMSVRQTCTNEGSSGVTRRRPAPIWQKKIVWEMSFSVNLDWIHQLKCLVTGK